MSPPIDEIDTTLKSALRGLTGDAAIAWAHGLNRGTKLAAELQDLRDNPYRQLEEVILHLKWEKDPSAWMSLISALPEREHAIRHTAKLLEINLPPCATHQSCTATGAPHDIGIIGASATKDTGSASTPGLSAGDDRTDSEPLRGPNNPASRPVLWVMSDVARAMWRPGQSRRTLAIVAVVLAAALLVSELPQSDSKTALTSDLALPAGATMSTPLEPQSDPRPRLAPAPMAALKISLLYLDGTQPGSAVQATGVDRLADALDAVLSRRPRAVLLAHAFDSTTNVDPLLATLERRGPDGPRVLALLPDLRAQASGPSTKANLASSALPVCGDGRTRRCVDMLLEVPLEPSDVPWTAAAGAPLNHRTRSLSRMTRCLGSTPTAQLALAMLARLDPGEGSSLNGSIRSACTDASVQIRTPSGAACDFPYRWLWLSDLTGEVAAPPHRPFEEAETSVCPGWTDLTDRIVIVSDPWARDPAAGPVTLEVFDEGGETTRWQGAFAEGLAILAWNMLGWLENE